MNMVDLIRIGLMIATAFLIILLLRKAGEANLNENTAEQMVLDRMIHNSISGISYLDRNGLAHPGIVDLERFNQETIEQAITLPKYAGVKLSLESDDGSIKKIIYLNEDYAILASGTFSGYTSRKSYDPVTIRTESGDVSGVLEAIYVFKKK